MASNATYQNLRWQKRNAEAQRDNYQRQINALQYKISRLKSVKKIIERQKNDFNSIKTTSKKIIEGEYDWYGTQYEKYKTLGQDVIWANDAYYKNVLDYTLDSLNDEITRLENEVLTTKGLMGRVFSWINSLSNQIENFFN